MEEEMKSESLYAVWRSNNYGTGYIAVSSCSTKNLCRWSCGEINRCIVAKICETLLTLSSKV